MLFLDLQCGNGYGEYCVKVYFYGDWWNVYVYCQGIEFQYQQYCYVFIEVLYCNGVICFD